MRQLLPLLLLAGCGGLSADIPRDLNALIGAREDQLISTLGVPNRTYEVGTTSVLGYDLDRIYGDPDARPPSVVPRDAVPVPGCELAFFVRDAGFLPRSRRVERYAYTGPACR